MSNRVPEFFVFVAIVVVAGNAIRGELGFGLLLGAAWLVAAYVQWRRREKPAPKPD